MTSSLEITSIQLGALAFLFTAGGALWALFRLVTTSAEGVRKEAEANVEKTAAVEGKARHDLANNIQIQLAKFENELERLKRETVRREDMAAIENRLTAAFTKIETKVDTISERLQALPSLEGRITGVDSRLDAVIRRLDGKELSPR